MTHGRCFQGQAGGVPGTAVRVAAAALVIAAMLAALWAGPAAAASGTRGQTLTARSARHLRSSTTSFRSPGTGPRWRSTGSRCATLGSSHRYIEIFNLNQGRLQPDGGRLESPHTIDPGWILQLPADAAGPGVHFGRLPSRQDIRLPRRSSRPSRPAAGGAAAPGARRGSRRHGQRLLAGLALTAMAVAGLAFGIIRRRRGGAARQRKPSHAGALAPRDSAGRCRSSVARNPRRRPAPGRPGPAGRPGFPGGHPGFRAITRAARPPELPRRHPSFPGGHPGFRGDHPSFPGGDHPSFPRAGGGSAGPRPDSSPGRPTIVARRAQRLLLACAIRPGAGGPLAAGRSGGPAAAVASAGREDRDPAPSAYQQVAFGDARLQVVLAEAGRLRLAGRDRSWRPSPRTWSSWPARRPCGPAG